MIKEKIIELLMSTGRDNMELLIKHMEESCFFTSPCSTQYHLAKEGGLAEHSLNVFKTAEKVNLLLDNQRHDSLKIVCLLHDLGKMGQFGQANYLKAPPLKSGKEPAKPYITNPSLMYVPHEVRSIQIVSQFIGLTEEENFAILQHNGMYGDLKYSLQGKETPLQMILHFADMWASRVIEKEVEEE